MKSLEEIEAEVLKAAKENAKAKKADKQIAPFLIVATCLFVASIFLWIYISSFFAILFFSSLASFMLWSTVLPFGKVDQEKINVEVKNVIAERMQDYLNNSQQITNGFEKLRQDFNNNLEELKKGFEKDKNNLKEQQAGLDHDFQLLKELDASA